MLTLTLALRMISTVVLGLCLRGKTVTRVPSLALRLRLRLRGSRSREAIVLHRRAGRRRHLRVCLGAWRRVRLRRHGRGGHRERVRARRGQGQRERVPRGVLLRLLRAWR